MKYLPVTLIYSRIIAGMAILLLALFPPLHCGLFITLLIAYGLVSDILDGIIARRLGISTEKMRRMDSSADQVFWIFVIISSYLLAPLFYRLHWQSITILAALEVITYLISYVRFGREVATHAIASKIWTLFLFAVLIQLILQGTSGWLFYIFMITGIFSRIEIILILMVLKSWANDVPSFYHALLIRQGKPIKRSKWFNG